MFEASIQVSIYYNVLLFIVIFTAFFLAIKPLDFQREFKYNGMFSIFLVIYVVLFIGYREWWVEEVFVDSIRYGYQYLSIEWSDLLNSKDLAYALLQLICKHLGLSVDLFFIVCAFLYVFPLFLISQKIEKENSSLILLVCIASMSFYGYGVNGIRNGIATSLMILAFSYKRQDIKQLVLFMLSIGFHLSTIIPIFCYFIVPFIKNKRIFSLLWIGSIPLSFFLMEALSSFVENFSLLEERAGGYFSQEVSSDKFSKTGFRYDFLIYSTIPIFIKYAFNKGKQVYNNTYEVLYYVYILTNSIWILVNQVAFSNRFAYLSWCIMPFISIYPILYWKSRYRSVILSFFIVCYFLVTYFI